MKKTFALVLAVMLVLTALPMMTAGAEGERVTLTMLQRLPAAYVVEDNPVIEAWGDLLGFDIEIEAPPISSFNDRRNIIMASGELPDIMYVGDTGTNYVQWATDGLFLNLTPYFNDEYLPNPVRVLTEDELSTVRIASLDGDIYSLPRVQTKPWDTLIYRKDWLDKLNLEVPKTPAEFAEVALAISTQDPDGNGENDTYGWALSLAMGPEHRSLLSGFGVRPSEVPDENGVYTHMYNQPAYMEYLDWCRDMYATGAMDPEFYLITMYEDDDWYYAGKLGIKYCNTITEHMITYKNNETFKSACPGFELVAGAPLMKEGESVANVYYNPQVWGNYAINADTEYLTEALHFLNMGYTDEVNELLMFGVEGITYTEFNAETRSTTKTEEQKLNADKYVASYATINYQREDKGLLIANGDTPEDVALFNESYNYVGALTNRVGYLSGNALPGVADVNVAITDEGIDTTFEELRTKYICGQIEREELVSFLENTWAPAVQPMLDIYAANNWNAAK